MMQESKPIRTFTDAELQAHHQSRRRWIIRICLSSLFGLIFLTLPVFILLGSSNLTAEEAVQTFNQLKEEESTREEIEHLLGLPWSIQDTDDGGLTEVSWVLIKHSI